MTSQIFETLVRKDPKINWIGKIADKPTQAVAFAALAKQLMPLESVQIEKPAF